MEYKTDALLLRAVDYRENDKMVTLFTAEKGKIGAAIKGVKKASAKLRFAAQPFCFAEYVLAEKNGRNTVIGASLYDGFFSLRESVEAFYAGTAVCEACDKLMPEGLVSGETLVAAVSTLKGICEGEVSFSLISFLLTALKLSGYPLRAQDCAVCGKKLQGKLKFDMESGSFCCETCGKGTAASEITYRTLRAALMGEKLGDKEGEKRALRLLSSYFTYQTDAQINSLIEYIRLI